MVEKRKAWSGVIDFPLPGRCAKPRVKGLTMIIDKGLSLAETKNLLEVGSDYIDFLKLGFGTSAFYDEKFLQEKIKLVLSYGVEIYPGGTFLEVAVWQNKLDDYLAKAKELGFKTIEVSDGTIDLDTRKRKNIIKKAVKSGLQVLAEVGKKEGEIKEKKKIKQIKQDLDNGAWKVILEGRESGLGIGIYDGTGSIKQKELEYILIGVDDYDDIIWEAPLKQQQQELILQLGSNVNLGNIASNEVLSVEALRVGLRGDTFKSALKVKK